MTDAPTKQLLREWGSHMLSEERGVIGLGYPARATGSEAMERPIERSKAEQAEVERLSRVSRKPKIRDGKKVEHMIPMSQPHDSISSRARSPLYEPWPAEIRRAHNAIAMLPEDERTALVCRYASRLDQRACADELQVSRTLYREIAARAEGAVRVMLQNAAT